MRIADYFHRDRLVLKFCVSIVSNVGTLLNLERFYGDRDE